MLIAHASHWLVQVAYVAPVLGCLVWLGVVMRRERRQTRTEPPREPDRPR